MLCHRKNVLPWIQKSIKAYCYLSVLTDHYVIVSYTTTTNFYDDANTAVQLSTSVASVSATTTSDTNNDSADD